MMFNTHIVEVCDAIAPLCDVTTVITLMQCNKMIKNIMHDRISLAAAHDTSSRFVNFVRLASPLVNNVSTHAPFTPEFYKDWHTYITNHATAFDAAVIKKIITETDFMTNGETQQLVFDVFFCLPDLVSFDEHIKKIYVDRLDACFTETIDVLLDVFNEHTEDTSDQTMMRMFNPVITVFSKWLTWNIKHKVCAQGGILRSEFFVHELLMKFEYFIRESQIITDPTERKCFIKYVRETQRLATAWHSAVFMYYQIPCFGPQGGIYVVSAGRKVYLAPKCT